jgi:hypothetical protein
MPPFTPGQIWTYNTRPNEQSSRIIICRVESDPNLNQIVHIHVTGIRLKTNTPQAAQATKSTTCPTPPKPCKSA